MIVILVLALLGVPPARPFGDERHLLDRRLETLRRILPDGANPAADVAHVRELAEAARLAHIEVQARPALVEPAGRGDVALDISALGGYEEVARFFQKVALSHRLVDVESLTLTATTEDVVKLAAVVRLPFWPPRTPLPSPPESPQGRPAGVPRPALDAFLRDQALAYAKSDAIASRRRARRSPRLFLSELAAVARDRPLALGYASFAEEFTIRGICVGEGPLRAFESRLERGFFRVSDFLVAKQGACHRFEARGRSPVAGPDVELPVPVEDPFEQDATPCRADRDSSRTLVVRGRAPTAKDPGKGPLTLRLRDVDLTDVFHALSALGFSDYVVDEAVSGRTSVELTRATLDEALLALRKAAGLEIGDGGALRHVALTRSAAARSTAPASAAASAPPAAAGPPGRFALKRAEVRDLLAAMAEADPTLASLGPPGFLGRVSVWSTDAPLLSVRAALLEAAALAERVEEDRRILVRKTGANEPPVPVARSGGEPRLMLPREEMTVREFELAGIGGAGERLLAFAYSPTGQLYTYAPGDRLADGIVRTVNTTDVVLEGEDGPVQLALPPVDR